MDHDTKPCRDTLPSHLHALAVMREEFIDNPGTDADYDGIHGEMPFVEGIDEYAVHAAFFDHMMARFSSISREGKVRVHRCITVADLDEFIRSIGRRPLGSSWAWARDGASCHYHPEANEDHEIMLIADAPCNSIDWESSMRQNFGHPHEREIVVDGQVHTLKVEWNGVIVHQAEDAVA